jgi:p-methyltransferase
MVDCLILVERGISEPDLVKTLLTQAYRGYFGALRAGAPDETHDLFTAAGDRPLLADYGLATQISLTGVVLATELAAAGLRFEVIDDDDLVTLWGPVLRERLGRCRMVAVSTTYTVRLRTLTTLLEQLRRWAPEVPILVGGQGLSAWRLAHERPEELGAKLAAADALFFGEAEGSFAELVRRVADRRSVSGIPGAVDLTAGGFVGDPEPVEIDVDQTLLPRWDLLQEHDWNDGAVARWGLPKVAALEEGRGCSFKCKFCSYPLYAGFRRKSPERVTAELAAVAAAGFSTVSFCGAEFLSPLEKSRAVFAAIAAAALPIEIWAYARLDLVSYQPWIADSMDRANFRFIQFGMESGDRGVLKAMNKNYDPGRMAVGARLLRERGIEVYASLVLGYPGETAETLGNTLEVLAECDFEHLIVHSLQVVPGSPLWERRAEYGLAVTPQGFWSHPTMSLREMPAAIRRVVVETSRQTRSLLNNVTQNFAPRFFAGRPAFADLKAAARTLQDIAAAEWAPDGPDATLRRDLWQRLAGQIERVPPDLVGATP